jgi:hypothetical protein
MLEKHPLNSQGFLDRLRGRLWTRKQRLRECARSTELVQLQAKLRVSKRAPKNEREPWLDDGIQPPVVRKHMHGWFTAEELREAATSMSGIRRG